MTDLGVHLKNLLLGLWPMSARRLCRLETARDRLASDLAGLDSALRAERDFLRDEVSMTRRALEQAASGIAGLEAGHRDAAAARNQLQERQSALEQHLASGQVRLEQLLASAAARVADLEDGQRAATAAGQRLQERQYRFEQLLSGGADVWLPGARRTQDEAGPAVAVVLPTFNRAAFVGDAIASVQAQKLANWELVVVDDGSTDDTPAVIARFLADRRIRTVSQGRKTGSTAQIASSARARNRGIAETTAPLLAYLDSDNVWYPDFLQCAVDRFAAAPDVDLVYGALVTEHHSLDRQCILWEPFDRDRLLDGNFIDTNVIVHRRTLVGRFGMWDDAMPGLLDWDLVLRYTQDRPAVALNVLAALYRDCGDDRLHPKVPQDAAFGAIQRRWRAGRPEAAD